MKTKTPKTVTILGLGPSLEMYLDHVKRLGGQKALSEETWGINALGDIIQCDRVFHMDDLRVQEARAKAKPESNIAVMVEWMKHHKGPIYTSQLVEGYDGLVAYPLEKVVNHLGRPYFNSTAAYAVAYAIYLGVESINLFGFDFTYKNSHHAEQGRACVEYWLGVATARGIAIGIPENSTLLDAIEGQEIFYGYDAVDVTMAEKNGRTKISFKSKAIPTAEEIEARYDHSKHPNALVS